MGIHKKNRGWPAWGILSAMTIFYLVSVSAPVFSEDYFIEYLISGQSCEIVYAVTPFDSSEKTRKVFLRWFKQGVETVLSARQPLDIEWQQAPEGQAGLKEKQGLLLQYFPLSGWSYAPPLSAGL